MVINHPLKGGTWWFSVQGVGILGDIQRKIGGNGGKSVKMCRCFWKTEWNNGDVPPPKRWKLVVSSADGTQGVGILGDA